jgi:hypothetical protein
MVTGDYIFLRLSEQRKFEADTTATNNKAANSKINDFQTFIPGYL